MHYLGAVPNIRLLAVNPDPVALHGRRTTQRAGWCQAEQIAPQQIAVASGASVASVASERRDTTGRQIGRRDAPDAHQAASAIGRIGNTHHVVVVHPHPARMRQPTAAIEFTVPCLSLRNG